MKTSNKPAGHARLLERLGRIAEGPKAHGAPFCAVAAQHRPASRTVCRHAR